MSYRNYKKSPKNKIGKKMVNATSGEVGPPSIPITVRGGHTFRFAATAAITGRFLGFVEVLDLLCMATSSTAAWRLFGSVKLKRLQIWAASSSTGAPVTVSFTKQSSTVGNNGDSVLYSDTVLGSAHNAYICVKFSDREQVGQWQGSATSGSYGQITVPANAVVDLTISYTLNDNVVGPLAVTGAVSLATTGSVYQRALDNTQATPQLVAVSYLSI